MTLLISNLFHEQPEPEEEAEGEGQEEGEEETGQPFEGKCTEFLILMGDPSLPYTLGMRL